MTAAAPAGAGQGGRCGGGRLAGAVGRPGVGATGATGGRGARSEVLRRAEQPRAAWLLPAEYAHRPPVADDVRRPMAYRFFMKTIRAPTIRAPRWPARGRPAWPGWRGDVALALLVGVVQVVGTYFAGLHQGGRRPLDALVLGLLCAGPVALTVRRRYPVAVLVVVFAVTLLYGQLGYPRGPVFFSLIVAFVTAVLQGRRLAAWLALAAGLVAFLWLGYLLGREPPPSLAQAVGLAAWLLVLLTAAEVARARRERALEAVRTREEEARRRASEERLRIARELHDVLAHSISLINVQAGVALHLMDERPEQARTALAAIKQASKEALGELRSVLGVLRQTGEEPARAPPPGLARLDELVSQAALAGLEVRTRVEGAARPLPAGVDLAAFRIVQEALTNVARHAGAATATVRVAYGERDVIVQVDDDGRGVPPHGTSGGTSGGDRTSGSGTSGGGTSGDGTSGDGTSGGGNGIPGMRERAAALGGRLEAGPRPGGGFRVLAWLPVDGAATDGAGTGGAGTDGAGTDGAGTAAAGATGTGMGGADAGDAR